MSYVRYALVQACILHRNFPSSTQPGEERSRSGEWQGQEVEDQAGCVSPLIQIIV